MPTLIALAVTGLAGTAVTGMLLVGMPWSDDAASRLDAVVVDNQEVDDVDDDPTDDPTRDTNPRNSAGAVRAARLEEPEPKVSVAGCRIGGMPFVVG